MTESKADELRRLAPWTTIECDMCGSMHHATRAGGRVVAADTLLLCDGCEGHEQGRAAGDAEGYARAMREVEAHAEATALKHRAEIERGLVTSGRVRGGRALHEGANNALHTIAEWARARAEVPRG